MPIKILIADDNPKMLRVLNLTLSERPDWFICGWACDGLEAVSKAAELVPDIVILDLTMPNLNGLQAGRTIRTAAPEIRLLLLTQHNVDKALEYEARKAGFSGAVTKGMRNSLIDAIEALLRGESFFLKSSPVTPGTRSEPEPSTTGDIAEKQPTTEETN